MMRYALLLALTVVAASGAEAQSFSQQRAAQNARVQQIIPGDPRDGPSYVRRAYANDDTPRSARMSCLIRKADGQRVCHSFREWQQIALRMEREAAPRD